MVNYQHSLKVVRRITSTFTDDELPNFTEGREKINIAPTFTDSELPTFTEGRKKITITNVL